VSNSQTSEINMEKYPEVAAVEITREEGIIIGKFLRWLHYERGLHVCEYEDEKKIYKPFMVEDGNEIDVMLSDYFGVNFEEFERELLEMNENYSINEYRQMVVNMRFPQKKQS